LYVSQGNKVIKRRRDANINGPLRLRATQLVGVFLVAIAGALLVGLVHAVRRRSSDDLLMLAVLLTGPLVASLGGEAQTIWRTLQLAPIGVLLAVLGLRQVSGVDTRGARLGIVAIFAVAIVLAAWYHDFLPHAQGLVRAATVPLAVIGLSAVALPLARQRLSLGAAIVSGVVLVAMHAAYFAADYATATAVVMMALLALAAIYDRTPERFSREPLWTAALIALVTGLFMYLYVDYGQIRRVGPIPASALVMGLRLAVASSALAAVVLVARFVGSDPVASGSSQTSSPRERGHHVGFETAGLVAAQVAYYGIDAFTDYRLRAVHAAVVVIAVIGLAALLRRAREAGVNFGHVAIAGVFGLASIQFATFYVDYVTEFQARGSAEVEGNMKVPFELVIDRTADRPAPAIYLGRLGPYYYGELFWKFYLIKHGREDLLARTIADGEFKPDRVRALPSGSLVITSPTREIDSQIEDQGVSVLQDAEEHFQVAAAVGDRADVQGRVEPPDAGKQAQPVGHVRPRPELAGVDVG
jgi:hypothetical protein